MGVCKSEETWAHFVTLLSLSWVYVELWLVKCYHWEKLGTEYMDGTISVLLPSFCDTLQWHTPSIQATPPNPNSPPTGNQPFRSMSHSHSNCHRRRYSPSGTEEKQASRKPVHERNTHLQIWKPKWEHRQTLYSCVPGVFSGVTSGLNGHFLNCFELWKPWRKSVYVTAVPQTCMTWGKGCSCLAHD